MDGRIDVVKDPQVTDKDQGLGLGGLAQGMELLPVDAVAHHLEIGLGTGPGQRRGACRPGRIYK